MPLVEAMRNGVGRGAIIKLKRSRPLPIVSTFCQELSWRHVTQARMWSLGIVIDPPSLNDLPCMTVTREQMLIQTLVTKATVEALDKTVLHRFPGLDVMPLDAGVFLPFENGVRCQFRPVIADDHLGQPTRFSNPVELSGNANAGD